MKAYSDGKSDISLVETLVVFDAELDLVNEDGHSFRNMAAVSRNMSIAMQ